MHIDTDGKVCRVQSHARGVHVGVGVRMQNVRASVKVLEF